MAILDSVKELASKLGAETNGRDITDQLNKINKHLDETALSGRDIAEAVKTYSENAGGSVTITTLHTRIRENGDYLGDLDFLSSSDGIYDLSSVTSPREYILLLTPAKKIIYYSSWDQKITFTPAEDYDGIYSTMGGSTPSKIESFDGIVTPGDGKTYGLRNQAMGGPTLKKYNDDFTITIS